MTNEEMVTRIQEVTDRVRNHDYGFVDDFSIQNLVEDLEAIISKQE